MEISCVICTKGRQSIYKAIDSIIKQTHPVNLIVIDDCSVNQLNIRDRSIKVIRNKTKKGLSVCRNIGYKMSKGDIIVFMDDDAIADPNWLVELEKCFYDGADIAGGLIVPIWEQNKPWWLKESMYNLIGLNEPTHWILGCNFAIRKGLLEKMNRCFEEKLGRKEGNLIAGDETTLFFEAERLGYKILFNEKAIVHHIVSRERLTFYYFIRRFFWEGRTEARRGTAQGYLIGRLQNILLGYPSKIAKSLSLRTFKKDILIDFLVNVFFTVPYLYGILYESLYGATDYGSI
ncbi:MAG: glycosyltransferase family 2 protein [Candidatus Bathyarchaeia archaeon]